MTNIDVMDVEHEPLVAATGSAAHQSVDQLVAGASSRV